MGLFSTPRLNLHTDYGCGPEFEHSARDLDVGLAELPTITVRLLSVRLAEFLLYGA
jgi:hypothetical protein